MEIQIDSFSTPNIWGMSDTTPALEIYANDLFETSDQKPVLPGNPTIGDLRHRVVGMVSSGVASFPAVTGIYTTEDSPTNQRATYSAFIRVRGRELIPFLERFRLPTLPVGNSMSWNTIRLHNSAPLARLNNDTYTRQQILDLIAGLPAPTVPDASASVKGKAKLSLDPAGEPTAVGTNDYADLSHAGIVELSVAPDDPATPIALGVNDPILSDISDTLAAATDEATPDTLALRDANGRSKFAGLLVKGSTDNFLLDVVRASNRIAMGYDSSGDTAEYKLSVIYNTTDNTNGSQSGYALTTRVNLQAPSGSCNLNAKGVYGTLWTTGGATYTGQISAVAGNAYMIAGSGPVGSVATGPGNNGFMAGLYGRVRNESSSDMWLGYGCVIDGPYAVGSGHIRKYVALKIIEPYTGLIDGNYGIVQNGGGYNLFSGATGIGVDPNGTGAGTDPMAALDVFGGPGGSTDIQRWNYATGETVIRVSEGGALSIGPNDDAPVIGQLTVLSGGTGSTTAVLKGINGQTADILQIIHHSAGVIFSVANAGGVSIWDGSSLKVISIGANDSAGAGFRQLRIANP